MIWQMVEDAFGRPFALRLDSLAALDGALDPGDRTGDLWAAHPVQPYCRATLLSGAHVYLSADSAQRLLTLLQPAPSLR